MQGISLAAPASRHRADDAILSMYLEYNAMNFYFESAKVLDQLDAKRGSIKGVIATLPEKSRKRTAAIVIETLKCE